MNRIKKKSEAIIHCFSQITNCDRKKSSSSFKINKITYLYKCSRTGCFIIDVTSYGSLEYK